MTGAAIDPLTVALRTVLDAGQRPPCCGVDAARWTSNNINDRREAAKACGWCPIRQQCDAAVQQLPKARQWHVWAGVDYTTAHQPASEAAA